MTDRAAYWAKAEERLICAYTIEKTLHTPVNFIVHSLHEVNDGLSHGRVFFMEVAKDGIAIYEADDSELATPKPKTPEQALETAREYFEEWMPSAAGFLDTSKYARSRGRLKESAFQLHQATERLYGCLLLTLTFYSPLCRVRHKGVYAERNTMPSGRWMSRLSGNFAVIGSA